MYIRLWDMLIVHEKELALTRKKLQISETMQSVEQAIWMVWSMK